MSFIASVVHPTDFSAASQRAFAHAMAVALIRRARLTLLHVSNDGGGEWSGFPAVRQTLERWHLLQPGSTQAEVATQVGVKVKKVTVSSRSPVSAVTNYVHRKPTDLLVVATERRDGLARFLRGSTAAAIARRSRTMTLFVPGDAERCLVSLEDGSLTLRNILIPVDHAPDPGAAIEFARRVAGISPGDRVTITLLHVGAAMPDVTCADGPEWRVARVMRGGDPVEQIVGMADALKAELIVMPTAGRAGVFEALRGSTTERVLRLASCPLLAVPAGSLAEPGKRPAIAEQTPSSSRRSPAWEPTLSARTSATPFALSDARRSLRPPSWSPWALASASSDRPLPSSTPTCSSRSTCPTRTGCIP
jgi:nucleotide-binding universal stress UspA family protein